MLTFSVDEFRIQFSIGNHPGQFHHDGGVGTDGIGADHFHFRVFRALSSRCAAAQHSVLCHDLSSGLKWFFQANDPILKIQLRDRAERAQRALVNANAAAFAEFPVPFHAILFANRNRDAFEQRFNHLVALVEEELKPIPRTSRRKQVATVAGN